MRVRSIEAVCDKADIEYFRRAHRIVEFGAEEYLAVFLCHVNSDVRNDVREFVNDISEQVFVSNVVDDERNELH